METEAPCSCSCICCSTPSSTWRRSLRRKLEQLRIQEEELEKKKKSNSDDDDDDSIARVEIENEVMALREALCRQLLSIHSLQSELDEERNSSATAASEAMSMILRLQREKAEVQMELRQFKLFAEEKASHDQDQIAALEDLIFEKDRAIYSLSCEVEDYKHRLLSCGFGLGLATSERQTPNTTGSLAFDYPLLRCNVRPGSSTEEDGGFQPRIARMERSSSRDEGVSPSFPVFLDRTSEKDEVGDRVYTVDAVHGAPDDSVSTPREFLKVAKDRKISNGGVEEEDEEEIKRLYMRMEALEADRESMRQTIMLMGTDKAQIVLLKEIALQLCKEVPPSKKKISKKQSFVSRFSIMSAIKWVVSFVWWRKKSSRVRYTIGMSGNNVGLLLLLEKSTRVRQKRYLTRKLR